MLETCGSNARVHEDDPDVLIVGAGAVGLALGISLARNGKRVTILEAGGANPSLDYRRDNFATVTGKAHRGAHDGRVRALGGTTRVWGGQLVEFSPHDFDGDSVAGRQRWPVKHSELTPFFVKAYSFLGISSAGADQDSVWSRLTSKSASFGLGARLGLNIWLPQPDFSKLFCKEIETLTNLRVILKAEVQGLSMSSDGRRVLGVRVNCGSGAELREFAAPIVVLANGTLELVRVLLRTAAAEVPCGFSCNRWIGKGFVDHLHGYAGQIIVRDAKAMSELFDNIYFQGRKYSVKLRMSDESRSRLHLGNCAATINAPLGVGGILLEARDLLARLLRGNGLKERLYAIKRLPSVLTMMTPVIWRYVVEHRSTSFLSNGEVMLGLELEQIVNFDSFLALDPSDDVANAKILVHWAFDGRELDAAAAMCVDVATEFERRGLGTINIDPRILARDPSFLDSCHDSSHQMGGARMADTESEGVADRNLRVFGTDNLYVLGAATFCSGSFANPTLTALAFAMRMADQIVQGELS